MTTTDLEAAAASTVEEAALACGNLDELMGCLAPCFARVEPRRQARSGRRVRSQRPYRPPGCSSGGGRGSCGAERVPAHLRNEIRVECDAGPGHLTIVECRPPWRKELGEAWTRFPIARLRYTKATKRWSLYWRDRHLRFHRYDRLAPSPRIEDLLQEIDRDPTAIFWG